MLMHGYTTCKDIFWKLGKMLIQSSQAISSVRWLKIDTSGTNLLPIISIMSRHYPDNGDGVSFLQIDMADRPGRFY